MKKTIIKLFSILFAVFFICSTLPFTVYGLEVPKRLKLLSSDPRIFTENIPADKVITFKFDQPIKLGTGEIIINYDGKTIESTAYVENDTLYIKPKTTLPYGKYISVTVTKGALIKQDGSPNEEPFKTGFRVQYNNQNTQQQTTPVQQSTTVTTTQPSQSIQQPTAPVAQQPIQQVKEIIVIEKGKPTTYQIHGQPAQYALWTSDPNIATVEVKNQQLIIHGIHEGNVQIAVRNTVNNNKVVLDVKVVQSLINL